MRFSSQRINRSARPLGFPLAALLSFGLSGCGGSGGDSAPASSRGAGVRFTVEWPQSGRLVPIAARAVRIEILRGDTVVAAKAGARGSEPTTTIALENVPAGDLTFRAAAYPQVSFDAENNAVASGVPQAVGQAPVRTAAGVTAAVTITMDSTIVRLAINPSSVKVKKDAATTPLVATGYDAQDRVVLTDADRGFTWTSSAPSIVAVGGNNNGAYQGLALGTATLTATDRESGKSATATVEVVENLPVDRVVLSPATLSLESGASGTLSAQALDAEGEDLEYAADRFDWASSDPTKATVSAAGLVTAVTEGSATVTATERTTGKSATAAITVSRVESSAGVVFEGQLGSQYGIYRVKSATTFEYVSALAGQIQAGGEQLSRAMSSRDASAYLWYTSNSFSGPPAVRTLYLGDAAGQGLRSIFAHEGRRGFQFTFNADGSRALLADLPSTSGDSPGRLFAVDVATGQLTPWTVSPLLQRLRALNPQGDRYVGQLTEESEARSYILSPDGSVKVRVPLGRTTFNRDGSRLCIVNGANNVKIVTLDGVELSSFTIQGALSENIRFHPTEDRVIYLRGSYGSNDTQTIYSVALDGSDERVEFSLPGGPIIFRFPSIE